jgi:glycerol-3-phosphate dehydrogenase
VINSAGVYSDEIAQMSGETRFKIYPCRGEYYILDKNASNLISRLVYPVPPKNAGGYGIHLTPTVEGNMLIGPSNEYIDYKDDRATTREVMAQLFKEARDFAPKISPRHFIRSYSGVRSKIVPPEIGGFTDFVIEESPNYQNFINLIGIESPGLTASPGIARYVVEMIDRREKLQKKNDFDGTRKGITVFNELSVEEKARLIKENPNYGEVVCRCENVTRQEIIDALNNPLGVRTVKGIKYRTRASMGRCQGGYCMSRIAKILEEEFGQSVEKIALEGGNSNLFTGKVRG